VIVVIAEHLHASAVVRLLLLQLLISAAAGTHVDVGALQYDRKKESTGSLGRVAPPPAVPQQALQQQTLLELELLQLVQFCVMGARRHFLALRRRHTVFAVVRIVIAVRRKLPLIELHPGNAANDDHRTRGQPKGCQQTLWKRVLILFELIGMIFKTIRPVGTLFK